MFRLDGHRIGDAWYYAESETVHAWFPPCPSTRKPAGESTTAGRGGRDGYSRNERLMLKTVDAGVDTEERLMQGAGEWPMT